MTPPRLELMIDCPDALDLAPFWAAVLGYEVGEGEGRPYVNLLPPAGSPHVGLQTVPEPKVGKTRNFQILPTRSAPSSASAPKTPDTSVASGQMAGFLTDEWLDELDGVARGAKVDPGLRLRVQQVVPDGPEGREVTYVVEVDGGCVRVHRGRSADADVTFTQDLATAQAIHRGELSAQAAFMEGRLRLGGDLRAVIDRAAALAAIDDVFAGARA